MPRIPRKIQGGSAYVAEWNAMVDYLTSLRPAMSAGTLTEHTPYGVIRRSKSAVGRRVNIAGLTRFRLKCVYGDYVKGHKVTGFPTDSGGVVEDDKDYWIAKTPDLRHSLASQVIYGITVVYSSYAINSSGICSRVATDSSGSYPAQCEVVIPVYIIGTGSDAEFWAFEPTGGTGVKGKGAETIGGTSVEGCPDGEEISWLLVDNRAWCQVA